MSAYPTPPGKLTSQELEQVERLTHHKLHVLINHVTREEWALGATWYVEAGNLSRRMAEKHDLPSVYVAGIMAVLSPRVRWDDNIKDTENVLTDGEEAATMALGPNVAKALWIIDGTDPDTELGGRKVRSFWRNISDPHGSLDVTLDGWMVKALDLPDTRGRYLERVGVYDAISDAFRTVAAERGIMPHELQATIWINVRGSAK